MTDIITKIIDHLKNKIEIQPGSCFFNEAAGAMDILDLETELGIELPRAYKIFLNNFNGGFICDDKLAKIAKEKDGFESAQWNSIHLFGLEEIREVYEEKRFMKWKLFDFKPDIYPYIPFCRTSIGELLIFVNPLGDNFECPVFDACHEEFPNSWGTLYNNFTDFLEDYITNDGDIPTTSYDPPTVEEFLINLKQ